MIDAKWIEKNALIVTFQNGWSIHRMTDSRWSVLNIKGTILLTCDKAEQAIELALRQEPMCGSNFGKVIPLQNALRN